MGRSGGEKLLRLQIGVGTPPHRAVNAQSLEQFDDAQLSAAEAAEVLEAVFPAAYEWFQKRWFGGSIITDGAVFRKLLSQDLRQSRPEAKMPRTVEAAKAAAINAALASTRRSFHAAPSSTSAARHPFRASTRAA